MGGQTDRLSRLKDQHYLSLAVAMRMSLVLSIFSTRMTCEITGIGQKAYIKTDPLRWIVLHREPVLRST